MHIINTKTIGRDRKPQPARVLNLWHAECGFSFWLFFVIISLLLLLLFALRISNTQAGIRAHKLVAIDFNLHGSSTIYPEYS